MSMANDRTPTGELTAEAQTSLSATPSTQWAADLGWMPQCWDCREAAPLPGQAAERPARAGADATAGGGSQPSTDAQGPNSCAIRLGRIRGNQFVVFSGSQYVAQRADQTGVVEHFNHTQIKSTDRVQVDIETGHAHIVPTARLRQLLGMRVGLLG